MKLFIAILLSIIGANACFAQSLILNGRVCDQNDKEDLVGATVRLLSLPDSAFVSASSAYRRVVHNGEEEITSAFTLNLPSRKSYYLIKVSALGYNTESIQVDPSAYGERIRTAELPLISLSPKTRELREVTVQTSRIKF